MSNSGQKFVARNRAPRVQIEYDVELYGAEKTVQLPFVMGVMADLSGKSNAAIPSVADRKFLEIDVDNFDDRMKSMAPRAAFSVPNTLTGDGNLSVDLTFEKMEDFSPAAIANKVAPLRKLLDARTQLAHLSTYMDGKTGAEDLIAKLIADPASFAAMANVAKVAQTDNTAALDDLRAVGAALPEDAADTAADDALADLAAMTVETETEETGTEDALDALRDTAMDLPEEDDDSTDDILAELAETAPDTDDAEDDSDAALDALRANTPTDDAAEEDVNLTDMFAVEDDESDLSALMDEDVSDDADDDLTDLGLDDQDDPLANSDDEDEADLWSDDDTDTESDLDDLLSDHEDDDGTDLKDLLSDDEDDADLDGLLSEDDDDDTSPVIEDPFGSISVEKPTDLDQSKKFRIAIMGDFSGRASRGDMEIGEDLAKRKPIKFDIDNLDAVIARFATTLVLPIGQDGAGVEVKLNMLDDLHPDELYENVDIFAELAGLRQRVAMGDGAKAIADMQGWADTFGDLKLTARSRAKGTAVPADRKLSDFQSLIGDMQGTLSTATPADELIARIVGPYVQAAADPAQDTMLAAIDEALSGAMRTILHHPDFQAVESTWRSLELIARRIETRAGLDVVLYDVSAEEWAADLSAQEDLSTSGLFQMLAEEPRLDEAQGPLSVVFGLYALEETPPHAELLARMSKISEWMNAPFMASISPKFLETPAADRHPLVVKAWDTLRSLPAASFIGLTSPRFLLRLPYGAKTEPVDPFNFEEFTMRSGLKGMLWANPVVLSAILLAETVNQKGKDMKLGDIMSLDDMPFHYMTDQYGDQVALPCTERLLNTRTAADVISRGFIPVLSIKGRNEVRQGSFQSIGAGGLAGPWGLNAASAGGIASTSVGLSAKLEQEEPEQAAPPVGDGEDADDDDDDFGFGGDDDAGDDDFSFGEDDDADDDDDDLDDLLSGFGDDDDSDDGDDDDMDPELAAMLEGL